MYSSVCTCVRKRLREKKLASVFVLACDKLPFQSKLNWGQVILSRAPSPCGAPVVFELRCLSKAPLRLLSTYRTIVSNSPSSIAQSWRCWNLPTPPSWCTISTVYTGNPGRLCSTKARQAWASTSWAVKMARVSLSPSSWQEGLLTWVESWREVTRSYRWVSPLSLIDTWHTHVGKHSKVSPIISLVLSYVLKMPLITSNASSFHTNVNNLLTCSMIQIHSGKTCMFPAY